jgi:hypothetical protein
MIPAAGRFLSAATHSSIPPVAREGVGIDASGRRRELRPPAILEARGVSSFPGPQGRLSVGSCVVEVNGDQQVKGNDA